MKNLSKFISILDLTREQVQYGYFLAGVNRHETSNLAEHHYLVTMIGWLLCETINQSEPLIDTDRVIKMCLVHDLGELFGGDMAAPLSRKRPDIKKYARAFEHGNFEILLSFLEPDLSKKIGDYWQTSEQLSTDEAIVAKIADMMETHFFLEHRSIQHEQKDAFYSDHIRPMSAKLSNEKIRQHVDTFFEGFESAVKNKGFTPSKWVLE